MSRIQSGAGLASAAEAVVVALAAGGDDAAFGELVRRRQSWLRSLLRRLTRDAALADDLAQQAFILAWQKLPQLRTPAAIAGWLRSLAVNLWLQDRRAQREVALEGSAAAALDAQPAVVADPSVAIDLDRLLAALKPAERLGVVLCHAEGMSHAEIAAATGWPLGTVKSHVARGAMRLRHWLSEENP